MDFIEKNFDKQWNWGKISCNKFEEHDIIKKRLPVISEERLQLLQELHDFFDSPPKADSKHVIFRKGGVGYWDSWNSITTST
jgi:hypothetical protein